MIQYLRHHEIDNQKWDLLLSRSAQQQVYALSWYLDVVTPEWEAIVDQDGMGNYKMVFPVPCRRKYGIDYVQQPFYCQQLGLFSETESIPSFWYDQVIKTIYQRFRYIISLQFNTSNTFSKIDLPLEVGQSTTLYLPLNEAYNEIYQNYTRDRKMNLKRAHRSLLTIVESNDIEPLIDFFKSETQTRIYGGVSESAYTTLRQLYHALQVRGLARLLYTENEHGLKNAGCLFIVWRKQIIYIFNASSKHGRKLNGRTLIVDHIIQEYSGTDYVLDFESPGNEAMDIVHYYQSFGAMPAHFPVINYNRMPILIRWLKDLRMKWVRKLKGHGTH